MAAKTFWEEACRLDQYPKVSARIEQLCLSAESALADKRLWDSERLIDDAEADLHAARANRQMGSMVHRN